MNETPFSQLTPSQRRRVLNEDLAREIERGFNAGVLARAQGAPKPTPRHSPGTTFYVGFTQGCDIGFNLPPRTETPAATPPPLAALAPATSTTEERLEAVMNEVAALAGRVADLETAAVNWAPADKETQRPAPVKRRAPKKGKS